MVRLVRKLWVEQHKQRLYELHPITNAYALPGPQPFHLGLDSRNGGLQVVTHHDSVSDNISMVYLVLDLRFEQPKQ